VFLGAPVPANYYVLGRFSPHVLSGISQLTSGNNMGMSHWDRSGCGASTERLLALPPSTAYYLVSTYRNKVGDIAHPVLL
jgi:hypothetical protein